MAARAWCGRVVARGDTGTPFGIAGGDRVYFGQSNTKVQLFHSLVLLLVFRSSPFCFDFSLLLNSLLLKFSFVEFSFSFSFVVLLFKRMSSLWGQPQRHVARERGPIGCRGCVGGVDLRSAKQRFVRQRRRRWCDSTSWKNTPPPGVRPSK